MSSLGTNWMGFLMQHSRKHNQWHMSSSHLVTRELAAAVFMPSCASLIVYNHICIKIKRKVL